MTLREAMVASLKSAGWLEAWEDKCLWVAERDGDNVWIHAESQDGSLASFTVPLPIFKMHLAK